MAKKKIETLELPKMDSSIQVEDVTKKGKMIPEDKIRETVKALRIKHNGVKGQVFDDILEKLLEE